LSDDMMLGESIVILLNILLLSHVQRSRVELYFTHLSVKL
jgi:hypothetical protein